MIQPAQIQTIVQNQRTFFHSGATLAYEFRLKALKDLKEGIRQREASFRDALKADLGKPEYESYVTETGFILHELTQTMKKLRRWMGSRWRPTPLYLLPGSSQTLYSPLGVNLIISPFNYPMQLCMAPLIAAIAAGNTAVIKTSELTPAVGAVIQDLVQAVFTPEFVAFIPGEVRETKMLLEQKFDHIFFTGSPRVGAIVMAAAAPHLTPVTLELGGKTPCIVHSDATLSPAIQRIVYGKFINAGQTCVAPDYILVHKSLETQFIQKITDRIRSLYGPDPLQSPDLGRIVNIDHFKRLVALIDPAKVVIGGTHSEADRFIAPTVMSGVSLDDKIMADEIFGPILPVMTYDSLDQAEKIIAALPRHPLALYLFTQDRGLSKDMMTRLSFGGGCINHCIQHLANPYLPFGGHGGSGMGQYHGFDGFAQFSHKKGIYKAPSWGDLPLIYPPYRGKLKWIKTLFR